MMQGLMMMRIKFKGPIHVVLVVPRDAMLGLLSAGWHHIILLHIVKQECITIAVNVKYQPAGPLVLDSIALLRAELLRHV